MLEIGQENGKINAGELRAYMERFYRDGNHEHMVFPGMVYISHPTEYGTLYTKAELEAISGVCRAWKIPLYVDGAVWAMAWPVMETDVTLETWHDMQTCSTSAGTKVGALCGEAVVFPHGAPVYFMTMVKQQERCWRRAVFWGTVRCLFTDNLYLQISKNAIQTADRLKQALKEKNYQLLLDSPTNQIFVILEDEKLEELKKHVRYSFWEKSDDTHTVIRLATSWATAMEDVEKLIETL